MSDTDQEQQESSRFVRLLQPNKDLATNWTVDVARELEKYLQELSDGTLVGDGCFSLNFAEAALLIQGSIQIYSKKVEYLHTLVFHALEFLAQTKGIQSDKDSAQSDGNDAVGTLEEEGEDAFLKVDDIKEEANIDIDNEANEALSSVCVQKPPASLLVLEGEAVDVGGDAGELASYQISTCSLHRDFLLLDPCDAFAVDNYLNAIFSSQVRTSFREPRSPKSVGGTQRKRATSAQKTGHLSASRTARRHSNFHEDGCNETVPDFLDDSLPADLNFDGKETVFPTSQEQTDSPYYFKGHNEMEVGSDDDDEDDAWQLLNPHDPGNLVVRPYRKGLTCRKHKSKKAEKLSSEEEFPLARGLGPVSPQFHKLFEAIEKNGHSKQNVSVSLVFEKLRSSFYKNEATSFDGKGGSDNNGPDLSDDDDDRVHDATFGCPDNVIDNTFEPASAPAFEITDHLGQRYSCAGVDFNQNQSCNESTWDDGESFEKLCRAHMESLMRSIADCAKQTEMASRVSSWKQKIERNLEEQDSHPPFDIHVYGERVLDRLSSLKEENPNVTEVSFSDVVFGQECHEVARTFASLLQLVNNGNVALLKGSQGGETICFTAQKPFFVTLLDSKRRYEDILSRAPAMVIVQQPSKKASHKAQHKVYSSRQEEETITEDTDVASRRAKRRKSSKILAPSNDGRHMTRSASKKSSNNEKSYPRSPSGYTPLSKRLRLHSARSVEVEVAR